MVLRCYSASRANALAQISTGHTMCCLVLAQVWQDKAREAIFVLANRPSRLEN